MKVAKDTIAIFDYFDYREYLDDCFNHLKSKRRRFSYRAFSREMGVQSHNFLPRILTRQRNLSEDFVPLLTAYLGLGNKETRYFEALISFNNAKKPSLKEKCLKQLLSLRIIKEEHKIQDEKLHFFDKWYYPVIRELVTICDFHDDYAVLARRCIPRISSSQAKEAVMFLFKNGFIQREKDGLYRTVDAVIATDPEVDSAIIPKYHKVTLEQCVDAIETVKKEDRNFSSSTLLVSKELYNEFKTEFYHFRKRLLSLAKDCKNPEMVCFAGFQLLPRSKSEKGN
ncbi:MAG: TIGR02147 family protein [Chitinivibrionales bacterium]